MKIIEGRVRLAASDVANFLACRRLTQLDLLRARGELRPPREFDIGFQEGKRIAFQDRSVPYIFREGTAEAPYSALHREAGDVVRDGRLVPCVL